MDILPDSHFDEQRQHIASQQNKQRIEMHINDLKKEAKRQYDNDPAFTRLFVHDPQSNVFANCKIDYYESCYQDLGFEHRNVRFESCTIDGVAEPLSNFTETMYELHIGRNAKQIIGIVVAMNLDLPTYTLTSEKTKYNCEETRHTCYVDIPVRRLDMV